MYAAERVDARALDHLEVIVREAAEELAAWRARALKAEADAKAGGAAPSRGAASRGEAQARGDSVARAAVVAELEAENRVLRQRVEAARVRVADLVARLAFLEEQAGMAAGAGPGR
jgi:hypothetical protein